MITKEDLISLPFLDDMCEYFIKSNPKNNQNNKPKIANNENI
jgi:hypothetical protein